MTELERDGVVVSPSLLRLEEADCALLGSSNTFDLGMAEWTNGAIPTAGLPGTMSLFCLPISSVGLPKTIQLWS
jgi:hypothetical protein